MDHLLRTFASVPPASRVLVVGDGSPEASVALARLGFDLTVAASGVSASLLDGLAQALGADEALDRIVPATPEALPFGPASFDWIAAELHADQATDAVMGSLATVLRVGSWVWIGVDSPDLSPEELTALASGAGLALAETPQEDSAGGRRIVRGIYRRVDGTTTA